MAEKYQHQGIYPLAPASVMPRSDEEHATNNNYQSDAEMKKKKRMKCFAYIAAFVVIQTLVILVFSLTVMRVKTPKVRLQDVVVTNDGGNNVRFTARVAVKNTNFGHYKFESSMGAIKSGDNTVGQFTIQEARARARSTKRIYVIADLSSLNGTNSGPVALSVEARVRGEVKLLKVIEKKKTANMRCTMTVNLPTNAVQDLRCN